MAEYVGPFKPFDGQATSLCTLYSTCFSYMQFPFLMIEKFFILLKAEREKETPENFWY